MALVTRKLTLEEFEARYAHADRSYEFWYGEAVQKGMPTWVHGLLQKIIMQLLEQQGFIAASEVELRIEPGAHPRPDVIATRAKLPTGLYPTEALDVVVEIVSEDDRYPMAREKCRKYQAWGFGRIYLVDPRDRSVLEWRDGTEIPSSKLAGVPVEKIWQELGRQHSE